MSVIEPSGLLDYIRARCEANKARSQTDPRIRKRIERAAAFTAKMDAQPRLRVGGGEVAPAREAGGKCADCGAGTQKAYHAKCLDCWRGNPPHPVVRELASRLRVIK